MALRRIQELENYWRAVIFSFKSTKNLEDATVVCYPKIPIYMLNHAACINTKTEDCANLLNRVKKIFICQQVPFACFRITPLTHPNSFISTLKNDGFEDEGARASVMVFDKKEIPMQDAEVRIKRVTTDLQIEAFDELLLRIFGIPLNWRGRFDEFTKMCLQNAWCFYLAKIADKVVGTCALFSSGNVGGIFYLGTLPHYRRLGVGHTLIMQALKDSTDEGNLIHTLQTEAGGNTEQIYEKIGFKVDHSVQFFVRKVC